jgi:hypothetical protein
LKTSSPSSSVISAMPGSHGNAERLIRL